MVNETLVVMWGIKLLSTSLPTLITSKSLFKNYFSFWMCWCSVVTFSPFRWRRRTQFRRHRFDRRFRSDRSLWLPDSADPTSEIKTTSVLETTTAAIFSQRRWSRWRGLFPRSNFVHFYKENRISCLKLRNCISIFNLIRF